MDEKEAQIWRNWRRGRGGQAGAVRDRPPSLGLAVDALLAQIAYLLAAQHIEKAGP
jgi:hypothetical protein